MSLTFQVEPWSRFCVDADALMDRHWQESALDREKFPRALSAGVYSEADRAGSLCILTARRDGKICGYYISTIVAHPHYAGSGRMAFTDIYFLAPEERKAGLGIRLIIEAEQAMRERGAVKAYASTKIHQDLSPLFVGLGWKPTDITFTKLLEER